MKKTLVLSTMLFGAVSLMFTGCTKDSEGTEGAATAGSSGDGDGDGDGDATGGSETGGAETTNGSGLGFVPEEDFGGVSECDPFMQDCPEGEKCVPYGSTGGNWDANKCVMVEGSGAAGDSCTYGGVVEATDNCDAGTHCWDVVDVDGMLVGVCTPFCGGTADNPVCDPGTSCLIANEGSINLCVQTCDPLLQDCGEGLACFWANNGFNCIFTTQDIPLGEACGFINDCTEGHTCIGAEFMPECAGSACCSAFCDLDDPTCDLDGTECTTFFEEGMAPPGYEGVGVCILPGG